MAPKKSVFRQPGAQHFQLVHRSQRDPLINDPDAGQRVLKPIGRANDRDRKSGTTLAELESALDKTKIRANEGEAAVYGIAYDDSTYDYMQHLKPVGQSGGDSWLIAAPKGSGVAPGMKEKSKGKGKARAEELFADLPEVLASDKEITLQQAYAREEGIPTALQGLQPDMDPHLRQVLEALEDEAFEDEEGDEGWFGELVGGGAVEDGEEAAEFEFEEWGVDDEGDEEVVVYKGREQPEALPEDASWEDRFKAFKQQQKANGAGSEVDGEERSEMADTIGSLPASMADMIVRGGKKRRGKRGPSDATGMSMSSSSMFRNKGLTVLDNQFDQIERAYDIQEEDEDEEYHEDDNVSIAPSQMSRMSTFSSTSKMSLFSSASAAPPTVSREDFDAILDDFLDNFEVVGSKYRPALGTTRLSGPEKLEVLRNAVEDGAEGLGKEENRRRILEIERMGRGAGVGKIEKMTKIKREEDEGEKWDVETVLTTYTNTENHPAMMRSRNAAAAKARAGMVNGNPAVAPSASGDSDDSDDSGSETETEATRVTVARPKGETTDDRKARKAAVKAERSARRVEKKTRQEAFGTERRKALASHKKLVGGGRAADLLVGERGVVSLS